jgi:hypothetical protein
VDLIYTCGDTPNRCDINLLICVTVRKLYPSELSSYSIMSGCQLMHVPCCALLDYGQWMI